MTVEDKKFRIQIKCFGWGVRYMHACYMQHVTRMQNVVRLNIDLTLSFLTHQ